MSYGNDAHGIALIYVDDRKWEAVEHESAGTVQVFWAALGRMGNFL